MITNFPIIESPNMRKAKINLIKRDKLCINKLGYIRDRIQNLIQKNSIDANLNLDSHFSEQFSQQLKQFEPPAQSMMHLSPDSPKKINSLFKKSGDKLNRTFNRTKTDWQHNFIGEKYQNKIKQQMKFTKYSGLGFKGMEQRQRTISLNKISDEIISQRERVNVHRGLSESQLETVKKKIRQKRLSKQKVFYEIRKLNLNKSNQKSQKHISQYQKLVAISPWDDQIPKIWGKI